jgi:hypothetical protein
MQIVWMVIATVFVAGMIFFVTDSLTVTSIASAFTGVIGLFLGIDIMNMIRKTRELPAGVYKEINKHRYILALCLFGLLLIETFFISAKYDREMNSLYLCFGVGFIIVIGGLIGGIEGNKIVTGIPEPETKEEGA